MVSPEQWQLDEARREIVEASRNKLASRGVTAPSLRVEYVDTLHYRMDAVYRRDGTGFVLELPEHQKFSSVPKAIQLGPTYLYWLTKCPREVGHMSVTLSDGDSASMARFTPSSNRSFMVPIPDPYFFRSNGFVEFSQLADTQDVPWAERDEKLVWRGACSGGGSFDPGIGEQQPNAVAPRMRLILAGRNLPDVDFALYRGSMEMTREVLVRHGVLRDAVPEASWIGRKYAIDIDGQTNTWSNLIVRLHLGCCVLKVASERGFRQWYYDRLHPWEHFVPVKADLSDLAQQLDWVRSNDAKAREIAANGRRLARSLTFDAVEREAVELISQNWNRP